VKDNTSETLDIYVITFCFVWRSSEGWRKLLPLIWRHLLAK